MNMTNDTAKVMPNFGELGNGLGTGQINRNWTKER